MKAVMIVMMYSKGNVPSLDSSFVIVTIATQQITSKFNGMKQFYYIHDVYRLEMRTGSVRDGFALSVPLGGKTR